MTNRFMRQIRWQRSRRYFDGSFVVLTQGNTEHVSIIWPNLIRLAYYGLLAICLIAVGMRLRQTAFR